MPFRIENRGVFWLARMLGAVTQEDLEALAKAWELRESGTGTPACRAIDLSAVERFEVDFSAIRCFTEARGARHFDRPSRSAVIARTALQYGIARMFQSLNEHPQIEVCIVSSLSEAAAWLCEGDSTEENETRTSRAAHG